MMKQIQSFDFTEPSRQSNAAIPLIIYNLYKKWVKILWPILVGSAFSKSLSAEIVLGIIVALGAIYGLIAFVRYTFRIEDEELIIEKGVFKRSKMVIPFDRIQSINFKQGILHQALAVVELEIDSAGSKGVEFELYALKLKKAEALRSHILENRPAQISDLSENDIEKTIPQKEEELFRLTFKDLLSVGLTQNHFRSGLLPFALYYWLQNMLRDTDINLDEMILDNVDTDKIVQSGLMVLFFLALAYTVLAVLISLFLSILNYFDLRFIRLVDGFKVVYGFFTKRQITIKDSKVQIFHWHDNLLRKIPKIFSMQIKQASSTSVKKKGSSINLAGLSQNDIQTSLLAYFKDNNFTIEDFTQVSKWLFIRKAIFFSLGLISSIVLLYFFPQEKLLYAALAASILLTINAFKYNQKKRIGINKEVIHLKGGIYGDDNILFQTYKLQGIELKQSPFQRRKKLASLEFYTAAGNKKISYLPLVDAEHIRDFALMIVETDVREWM